MWLLGAILGLWLGSLINMQLAIPAMIAGAVIAHFMTRRMPDDRLDDLAQRVQRLEAELAELKQARHAQPQEPTTDSSVTEAAPVKASATPSFDTVADTPPVGDTLDPLPMQAAACVTAHEKPGLEEAESHDFQSSMPPWLQKLWGGNPLAKVGIVLLFFGFASGLRLAADYGLFPVPVRLLIAAAAGVVLLVFGMRKAAQADKRNFGLAIQGGGFAVLYLVIYFMVTRYAMLGATMAFAAFAVLGISCVFLAARQDGPALAVLGLSGAFLSPVLAGGHADSPTLLFAYFALLNAFIMAIDWFKAWRILNIAGFIYTLVIGMAWALEGYTPQHYFVTQAFLVLFLAAYSAMPVLTALLRAPGHIAWQEGMLIFGTPLIGAALQSRLMVDVHNGLAWSAFIGALWYFTLWLLMFRRTAEANAASRIIERSYLGIALALLTIAVPLAFDAQVTSAFWAAEGAAVLWFGLQRQRALAQWTGLLMQAAAGLALLLDWSHLSRLQAIANDAVVGGVILCAAGLFSARQARAHMDAGRAFITPALPFVWALLWWFGVGLDEIAHFAPRTQHAAYGLLLVTASQIGLEWLAVLWRWPQIHASSVLLLVALWLATLLNLAIAQHPFAGTMAIVLPLAFIMHGALLAIHERQNTVCCATARHLGAWWLALLALALEIIWQLQQTGLPDHFWRFATLVAISSIGIALPVWGIRRGRWPFAAPDGQYGNLGLLPPYALLLLLLVWGNLDLSGADGLGWPYLPILNCFDLLQLGGLAALRLGGQSLSDANPAAAPRLRATLNGIAFLWLSALAARSVHHWGGVAFTFDSLMASGLFQATLTLLWSTLAIATMILASRQGQRTRWFTGISLLGIVGGKLLLIDAADHGTLVWTATLIGVALLVLAAGYFAPLPPQAAKQATDA